MAEQTTQLSQCSLHKNSSTMSTTTTAASTYLTYRLWLLQSIEAIILFKLPAIDTKDYNQIFEILIYSITIIRVFCIRWNSDRCKIISLVPEYWNSVQIVISARNVICNILTCMYLNNETLRYENNGLSLKGLYMVEVTGNGKTH